MDRFDQFLRKGQTDKAQSVSPELWERLERRLDSPSIPQTSKRRSHVGITMSRYLIAASFAGLMTLVTFLSLRMDRYVVTDFDLEARPYFTKEDVHGLGEYYDLASQRLG
ncbi:MAG: hypothetical protein AAFQ02_10850 [Bacteroidota bacterium]